MTITFLLVKNLHEKTLTGWDQTCTKRSPWRDLEGLQKLCIQRIKLYQETPMKTPHGTLKVVHSLEKNQQHSPHPSPKELINWERINPRYLSGWISEKSMSERDAICYHSVQAWQYLDMRLNASSATAKICGSMEAISCPLYAWMVSLS